MGHVQDHGQRHRVQTKALGTVQDHGQSIKPTVQDHGQSIKPTAQDHGQCNKPSGQYQELRCSGPRTETLAATV